MSDVKQSRDEQRLYELWGEIRDLASVSELMEWDQETQMPKAAVASRGRMCATVAGLKHRLLVADELHEVIGRCAEQAEPESTLAEQVRCARRDVDRARRVPEDLTRALAQAKSRGTAAWQRARKESKFSLFEKELTELFRLRQEQAAAWLPDGKPYDAMLEAFDPGSREADLVPLFNELKAELTPLVAATRNSGVRVSRRDGEFAVDEQQKLSMKVVKALGFNTSAGRFDTSTHPFCIGITPTDVRLTWRWHNNDFAPALYGFLHECGHGLYEQGLPEALHGTPMGDAVSLGVHESQSRLWENQVGRSKGFWRWLWPEFTRRFPKYANRYDADSIWPTLHEVQPSLIRVEADQATYNLHVAIRFDIERALFAGDLKVRDLPGAWNDAYRDLLGVSASKDADGVLQDIHWSQGMFGYFPTYTIGSLLACQLFDTAQQELGDLDEAFARGEFQPLLDWLRDRVHRHAQRYTPSQLIQKATGKPLSTESFLRYLRGVLGEVYGVS